MPVDHAQDAGPGTTAWQDGRMQHASIAARRAAAAAAGPTAATTAAAGAKRHRGWAFLWAATVVLLLVLLPNASAGATPAGSGVGASGVGHSEAAQSEGATSAASAAPAGLARGGAGAAGTSGPDMKSKVESVLDTAVRSGGQPETAVIRESLVNAGIPAGDVEVTASRTPTGLAADAVEAGVRDGSSCVVAQLRSGSVAVSVLPVLASGGCLVGVQD